MIRAIATFIASLSFAAAAWAGTVCMDAAEMEAALIDWYAETPVPGAAALDQQLWASEETGTWTLMQLNTDGTACVVSQGNNWQASDHMLLALHEALGQNSAHATPDTLAFLDLLDR